jgi:hypothetical protein
MCSYENEVARLLWSKACNYHRGRDSSWNCGNPGACKRTLDEAERVEGQWLEFQKRWC